MWVRLGGAGGWDGGGLVMIDERVHPSHTVQDSTHHTHSSHDALQNPYAQYMTRCSIPVLFLK